ncbi:hypothetical protein LSCM1_06298 [Leishmania martiniquensis]|uniref:Uncharacterized protein n=1 Tax=Leishmania martiniquensis TaxID=1580590 RepID=A0A836GWU3_9TRYP|nr:hypothetical protein LSCM1_06298 [Leishmania martiniquensis]
MSHGRACIFSSFLRDDNTQTKRSRGGSHSDKSDSSDRSVNVVYDHHCGLPQHEPGDSTSLQNDGGPACQRPQQQQQQQQSSITQVPSASLTASLNSLRKGSVGSFPVSTFTPTAPHAAPCSTSALAGMVDEAVMTMDHAVRVPSALRGAGRRTMFDVLVNLAERQGRREVWQAKPRVPTEANNLAGEHAATARDVQAPAPSLRAASSAQEMTYQMLFPRSAVAAAAKRPSSSSTANAAPAVGSAQEAGGEHTASMAPPLDGAVKASPSRNMCTSASASLAPHLPMSLPSALPSARAKPDRRLRHLLPAHLRGGPAASQSGDDDWQGHKLQASPHVGNDRRQSPKAEHFAGLVALDAYDTSSISSFSDDDDDDTSSPGTRHLQPHLGTRREGAGSSDTAPRSRPQAAPVATRPTVLSRLINGDAEELVSLEAPREGPEPEQPKRPQQMAEGTETRWARREQVFMGAVEAAMPSSLADGPECVRDGLRHRRSRDRRAGRNTASRSSERSRTHCRATDPFASDSDSTSSGVDDSADDGGSVFGLRKDLDDEVPRWMRQHEATRGRLAAWQQQQVWQQVSWASPTFHETHTSVIERAAAALAGKPHMFCPSSMAPRIPSAASHAAGRVVGGRVAGSAASSMGRGRPDTRGTLAAAGAPGSLLAVWKEGRRLLKQRPPNTTAVAVVGYLWQRFQSWKPYGCQLLRQLRSGTCFGEAAAPPAGSPQSRSQRERRSGCLAVNQEWDAPRRDAVEATEEISGTSSGEDRAHTRAMQGKAARKPRQRRKEAAASSSPAQSLALNTTNSTGGGGGGAVGGVDVQVRVHYMESAFNVVVVHGELTYASESACARFGLAHPLLSSRCSSSYDRGRAEDAAATPTAHERRWTVLLPEPALKQVPVLLQEHIYLAPPYTVLREAQAVLSSYNFTSDALLRQHAEEEEVFQKANLQGCAPDEGDSGGRPSRATPTSSRSPGGNADRSAPPRWWAACEGNDRTPVREAASTRAGHPPHPAEETVAEVPPASFYRELCGAPLNADPARLRRTPPLEHPPRQQWPVVNKEGIYPRAPASDNVDAHSGIAVRQGGRSRVGASPEPHKPVARSPPLPPRLREAESGSDAVNAEARWRQGIPLVQSPLSPSYVRASTASVNSIIVDGFYDPLAMPALPTAGAERGAVRAWGSSGDVASGFSSAVADGTVAIARVSEHGADRVVAAADAVERRLASGPRELPVPPQLLASLSTSATPAVAANASGSVFGNGIGNSSEARGGDVLANDLSRVPAAVVSAAPLMDCLIGDGFPRGPTADWDVPVEVLFALCRGDGRFREKEEQPARHRWRHRNVGVDGISEENYVDGAFTAQECPTGVYTMATTSARLAQQPVDAHKLHQRETPTSGDDFTATAIVRSPSELRSSTASQLVSQMIPSSATFSYPTPRSPSASAAPSLASSAAPSSISLSSLSEPGDDCDDGVDGGGAAHATLPPRVMVEGRDRVRWPRHRSRCSGLSGTLASRRHEQQQHQERWMRVLWGRGKHHDESYGLPAIPSNASAVARAPANPSARTPPPHTSPSQRRFKECTVNSFSIAADAFTPVPSAESAAARATPVTKGPGLDPTARVAQPSSPLAVVHTAATETRTDAPVPHQHEGTQACTASTAFFALDDVYLSGAE